MGHAMVQLVEALRTGQRVAVLIPNYVTGISHWQNPTGRNMGPKSTQPLAEMSTRNIAWGIKAASAYGWQPYHLHVPTVSKSGILDLLEPSGPVQACARIAPLLHAKIHLKNMEFYSHTASPSTKLAYSYFNRTLNLRFLFKSDTPRLAQ